MSSTTTEVKLKTDQFESAADAAADSVKGVADALDGAAEAADNASEAATRWADNVRKGAERNKGFGIKQADGMSRLRKEQNASADSQGMLNRLMSKFGSPGNQRGIDGIGKGFGGIGKAAGAAGGTLAGVGLAVGAIVGAAMGLKALAQPFFEAAGAATVARDGMRAALDQVTGGRGTEAIAVLDKLAKGLNMPVQEVTDQFIALRKDGINNINSEKLIKLRADLLAVGVDAGTADKEIDKIKEGIKEGLDPNDMIKKSADKFGAMGDGANASADSVFTLEGALKRAALVGERLIGKLADKAGPVFDKAAVAISNVFAAIEEGQGTDKILDAIVAGMDVIVTVGTEMGKAVGPAIEVVGDAFGRLGEALGETTGESNTAKAAGQGLGLMLGMVAGAVAIVIDGVTMAVSAWSQFSQGARKVASTVNEMIAATKGAPAAMTSAGKELVMGFVNGIAGAATAAIAAASKMAEGAVDAVKSKLGIASPSKVAKSFGTNFGDTFSQALDDSMPDDVAMKVSKETLPQDFAFNTPSNDNSVTAPTQTVTASTGGGHTISIQVDVQVTQTNASVDDIEAASARGVEQGLRLAGVA